MNEGFIPLLIEHPDDRAEMERAIKVAGGIPIHERNREVVLITHTLLLEIADHHNLLQDDPKVIRDQLKQLAKEVDQILAADTTLKTMPKLIRLWLPCTA